MANCNNQKKIVVCYCDHGGGKSYLCFADEPDFTGHVSRYYALIDLKLCLVRTFKLQKTAWQYNCTLHETLKLMMRYMEMEQLGCANMKRSCTKAINLHAMQHMI